MKIETRSIQIIGMIPVLLALIGCTGQATILESTSTPQAAVTLLVEPSVTFTPIVAEPTGTPFVSGYQPVSAEVCQILQEQAAQSLGLTFTMEEGMPFVDYVTSETGWSCTLISNTNGASISDPNDALAKLVAGFVGWTEQTAYAAGGPTGAATAMTRDSGLMLISVSWEPSADISCPPDQPISACPMAPEKQLYTVEIEAAQK